MNWQLAQLSTTFVSKKKGWERSRRRGGERIFEISRLNRVWNIYNRDDYEIKKLDSIKLFMGFNKFDLRWYE